MRRGLGLFVLFGLLLITMSLGATMVFVLGWSPFADDLAATLFTYDVIGVIGSLLVVVVGSLIVKLFE